MNIVFVSHYSGAGGANNELCLLVRQLIKSYGHKVYVVVPCEGWICEELKGECEVVVSPVRYRRWTENQDAKLMSLRRIVKTLQNDRAASMLAHYFVDKSIDLVHTNDSITIVGAKLADKLKVPHIWHMREIFDSQFFMKHTYSEHYCNEWMKKAKTIIAISDAVLDRYNKYESLNIVKIYDGVKKQKVRENKGIHDPLTFLFCGGTSIDKGFDHVKFLAKKLRQEGKNFKIKVVASCNVDEELRTELHRDGTERNFEFLGFVDNLPDIRLTCDAMLMCSRAEAFGLVTVESMLSKVLVIGRNTGATPELIEDEETGYLYNTEENLCECVMGLWHNDVDEIVERAYEYAVANFSIDKVAEKINEIYKSV